jgi:GAF domain-containing protein
VFNQQGEVAAVLDIDSTDLATFDDTDQYYLEQMCQKLGKFFL